MSRWYIVCSAEFGTVIPILDDGTGPTEYGRDCLYVRAKNARRAKVLMVRARRRNKARVSWRDLRWLDDGTTPFRGMIAQRCGGPHEYEADA